MIERRLWERYGLDARYFLPVGAQGAAERWPEHCPVGHPLGPDRVLVAAHPCTCTPRPHRIWRCWECEGVFVRPPCAQHPEWVAWC